uniref:Transcriptional repressor p66 coiled-coil MBD2-interaction domain-containing protein n=1 Tax=Timema monikensis TaxID=170555 RepID=A0A7R9E8M6_9NEOP|nr:unnamed protein product [Timema monikensis]
MYDSRLILQELSRPSFRESGGWWARELGKLAGNKWCEIAAVTVETRSKPTEAMEKMDVDDDAVVDLSVKRERDMPAPQDLSRMHRPVMPEEVPIIPRSIKEFDDRYPRRNLRPRTERSYAESPDVIVVSDEEPRLNGFTNGFDSDTDDGEMPPLPPIKELSPTELAERERGLRKLREELRNEEMKLVLLKKLRQSQQMKENIAVVPPGQQPQLPKVTPPSGKLPAPPQQQQQQPPPPLVRANHTKQPVVPPLLRGQPNPARGQSVHHPPPLLMAPRGSSTQSSLPPNLLMAQQPLPRGSGNTLGRPPLNTTPNVVMGYPGGSQERGNNKESQHHSPAPSQIPSMPQPPQTPQPQIVTNVENKCSMNAPMPLIQEQGLHSAPREPGLRHSVLLYLIPRFDIGVEGSKRAQFNQSTRRMKLLGWINLRFPTLILVNGRHTSKKCTSSRTGGMCAECTSSRVGGMCAECTSSRVGGMCAERTSSRTDGVHQWLKIMSIQNTCDGGWPEASNGEAEHDKD